MEDIAKFSRALWICFPISMTLALVLNGCFSQQAIANLPVMVLLEQLRRHLAKQSLQRPLNNQILDYKAILDLRENEMMLIKFFRICYESMTSVPNLEIEEWYKSGDTVPVTRSSHHLVPLSSSPIGPKLTSKDEPYVDIQSISLCDLCIQLVLVGGMVFLVDIAGGDVNNIDLIHPRGPWKTYN